MKNTKNRIILVAEIVFVAALLWGSAQIIRAQNWQAPSRAFPGASVAAPLDVSSNPQTKTGSLTTLIKDFPYAPSLGIGYKNAIGGIAFNSTSLTPVFYPFTNIAGIDNQTQIQNGFGALYVNTKGLVLPNVEASLLNTATGTITYDPSSKTVKLYNGKWVDIGTGTGSGEWKTGMGGIYYDGGKVGIGVSNPSSLLHVGGSAQFDGNVTILSSKQTTTMVYLVGGILLTNNQIPYNSILSNAKIDKYWWSGASSQRMSCDKTVNQIDCSSVSGFIVEPDTSLPKKYDLSITAYRQTNYSGDCPLPPNGISDQTKCKYFTEYQKFDKKNIINGFFYYKLTGGVGGQNYGWPGGALGDVPKLACDKDDTKADCASEYSIDISANSPITLYDVYTQWECINEDLQSGVCYGYGDITYANEYTLVFTEGNGIQGGSLTANNVDVGLVNLKPTITGDTALIGNAGWFILNSGNYSCGEQNRGEMRFLKAKTQYESDRLCTCKYTNGYGTQWTCW